MSMIYRRTLILILLQIVGWCAAVRAQSDEEATCVYFRRGYSSLELAYRDNRQKMDSFVELLQEVQGDSSRRYYVLLSVAGHASPDGSQSANERLSGKRVDNVLAYIRQFVVLPDSLIRIEAEGVDWTGLTELVSRDADVPGRERVLDILHHTPIWIFDERGRIVDGRKKQLMDLMGGASYRYLLAHHFPELRNTTLQLCYDEESGAQPVMQSGVEPQRSVVASLRFAEPLPERDDASLREWSRTNASLLRAARTGVADEEPLHRLAIKTNLLYDAVLMPSLEVEYRIDDRWSVAVEGDVAWWKRDSKHKYYQIATILPEGRYWFCTKKPWHGHYVGLFGGGSWYDLENGGRGYKGEFWTAGISYGYMFPISRSFSFEAGIGIGFLRTWYEEYLPIDGHYVYQQSSRTNWFGPVKVKFALVYRLWDSRKKGGLQ